jgi:hypothetical protein
VDDMIGIVISVVGLIVIGIAGFWLAVVGGTAGDLAVDATSRLVAAPGRVPQLVVTNPGPEPVVVGMTARRHSANGRDALWAQLAVRPGRWYERRQSDRRAATMLGVVEPHSTQRWDLPWADQPSRVVVLLGQGGGRLRVHEHLAGPNDPGPTFVDTAA